MLKRFIGNLIKEKLTNKFPTGIIEVLNESKFHSKGENSHFKVVVTSDCFKGKSPLERRREVLKELQVFWDQGVHSISVFTYTIDESPSKIPASPRCVNSST
jgi:BolA protein